MEMCDRALPSETNVVEVFGSWVEDVERIDILLQAAERRFSATLHEIDRHLHGLGPFLREELDQIIEGSLVTPNAADGEIVSDAVRPDARFRSGPRASLAVDKFCPQDRRSQRIRPAEIADKKTNDWRPALAGEPMTSERQIAANRENAKKSTGPKTARGKAQASRNAVRHGLEGRRASDTVASDEVERIAKAICNADTDPFRYQQAMMIAESKLLVARVRAARLAAIERKRKPAVGGGAIERNSGHR